MSEHKIKRTSKQIKVPERIEAMEDQAVVAQYRFEKKT